MPACLSPGSFPPPCSMFQGQPAGLQYLFSLSAFSPGLSLLCESVAYLVIWLTCYQPESNKVTLFSCVSSHTQVSIFFLAIFSTFLLETMLLVVLKHYTVATKLNFRKAVMNLDAPRGKNVWESVWANPGSSPVERRKHINKMPGDMCSHRTNLDLAPSVMVHCVLNHVGILWVETTTDNEDQVYTGKKKSWMQDFTKQTWKCEYYHIEKGRYWKVVLMHSCELVTFHKRLVLKWLVR